MSSEPLTARELRNALLGGLLFWTLVVLGGELSVLYLQQGPTPPSPPIFTESAWHLTP